MVAALLLPSLMLAMGDQVFWSSICVALALTADLLFWGS